MIAVAARFAATMKEVLAVVDLTKATFDLAKQDPRRFRSTHPVAQAALHLQATAKRLTLATALPYEGAFLTACAEFELAVRELLESFAAAVASRVTTYSTLPDPIRKAHVKGAARVLQYIHYDKFRHLAPEIVISKLAGCVTQQPGSTYALVTEAFSDNEHNFKQQVISEHMNNIGLTEFWNKVSADADLVAFLGTSVGEMTKRAATQKLNSIMDRRNQLIHRGRGFAAASESEAREAASFFAIFITASAKVLTSHLASL